MPLPPQHSASSPSLGHYYHSGSTVCEYNSMWRLTDVETLVDSDVYVRNWGLGFMHGTSRYGKQDGDNQISSRCLQLPHSICLGWPHNADVIFTSAEEVTLSCIAACVCRCVHETRKTNCESILMIFSRKNAHALERNRAKLWESIRILLCISLQNSSSH